MKPAKRIIIILFVIQLVFPSALAISGAMRRSSFNKKAAEYKVRVENVDYFSNESRNVYVDIMNLCYLSYLTDEDKYVIFEETDNGFFKPKATPNIPENRAYINIEGGLKSYEYEKVKVNGSKVMYQESISFYSKEIEESNLAMKLISGEPTEAYAVIKVYENQLEITELYINGIEFSEYLKKYYDGELDISRYDNSLSYTSSDSTRYYDDEFRENATQIKVKVNEINCDYIDLMSGTVLVEVNDNSNSILDTSSEEGYFVFAEGENGMYVADFTSERPSHSLFAVRDTMYYDLVHEYELLDNRLYDYYSSKEVFDYTFFSIYSDDEGKDNYIVKVAGPPTEAYAVLNVYCGLTELVEVYVDDTPLNEYIAKFLDGELDLTEYNNRLKKAEESVL